MTKLDFSKAEIHQLITHHVGNKTREEGCDLSDETTAVSDDTKELLMKYFLHPIKGEEFYSFFHTVKLEMNEIYTIVSAIFSKPNKFIDASQNIAKLLYEQSVHPKIKEGELNVARISNIMLDEEQVDAVGIFKSETDSPFIKMKSHRTKFSIQHDFGFEIKGIDKACVIFNTEQKQGYKILIVDNANKSVEAQYWKDDFLKVRPISNEFHQTNEFLGITKEFVTNQISDDFEVTKADKIDLLNRSVEYFKTHEKFDKKEFEEEVFQDKSLIKSFEKFDNTYRMEYEVEINDQFEISPQAVKKQARVFKSVLKLDKNFHIYIHGNRELIEQGVEKDGRKFYKIYYQDES